MKSLAIAICFLCCASVRLANAQCNVFATPIQQVYQAPSVCQTYQAVGLQPAYASVPVVQNFAFQQGLAVPAPVYQPQYAYSAAAITALQPVVGVQSYFPTSISSHALYSNNVGFNNFNGFNGYGVGRNVGFNNFNGLNGHVHRNVGFNNLNNLNLNGIGRGTNITVNPPGLFNTTRIRVR